MQKPFRTVLICFFTVFIVSDRYNSSIPSDAIIRARSEIGAKEDPFARWRFDWLRTRDPQTKRIPEGIRQRELKFAKILPTAEQFRLNRGFGSRGTGWRKRGPYNV